jgi:acyl-CoA synthetase (NDP forming)
VAGLVVQSGGVGVALLGQLSRLGIGVSSFASVGDKYDVSSNDLLMWWAQDGVTRLAILYVESFGSPRKFARTARRVGHQMPVLTIVGGRSAAGQRAAAPGTAAAATLLTTQEALFGQAGVIAATSLGELTEAAALLASQPLPAGPRVAIVTNAGGAGVLAANACGDNGLQVAQLAGTTRRRLRRLLPAGAAVTGPVDTTAAVGNDAFRACLEEAAADDGVDAVLAVAMPTAISDLRTAITGAAVAKPIAAVLLDQAESVRMVPPGRPCYSFPEDAARALGHAARYRAWHDRPQGRVPELPGLRPADGRKLLAGFLGRHPAGGWLPPEQAAELLESYQIPLVASRPVCSEQEAARAAAELGGRVVLKAEADGLAHQSGAAAVKLDLRTPEEVTDAYHALEAGLGSSLQRVLVQPMIADGVELLIGVTQEPVFGPLVVFGIGGGATGLGDHAARLTPLTDTDADELIHAVPAGPLRLRHRGAPPADARALADTLLRVSRLADDLPEVAELDLSPVIARPDGVYAVGVRVRVSPAEPRDPFLRQLR